MSRTTLSICMALLVLTPSLLSAQERSQSFYNKYSDVLYNECWCFDSLIVVPDSTVHIDKSVYEKVIAFWNEQDLGIVLVLAETFVPEQRDYVVLIKEPKMIQDKRTDARVVISVYTRSFTKDQKRNALTDTVDTAI